MDFVWNAHVSPKVKSFIWGACKNILPVRLNLKKKKLIMDARCPIRGEPLQSMEHLLLLCCWTRPVWFGFPLQWHIKSSEVTSFDKWLSNRILSSTVLIKLERYGSYSF